MGNEIMIPVYLICCWVLGMLAGFMIGRYYKWKKILDKLNECLVRR